MNLTCASSSVRRLGAAAFVVLVVAIAAGPALADPAARTHDYFAQIAVGTRPDDRAGFRGVGGPLSASAAGATTAVRPDDRAGIRGVGSPLSAAAAGTTTAVRPDDRAGARGIGPTEVVAATATVDGSSSFDWRDAGIGAGGMLGLVLVAAALVLLFGRVRVPASHA